ncbi:MAG: Cna B-type domain-containing protein, partial [Solobacterium sp.]|nr:Cna B-type domain-containing protein [Solobacterium sp.]
MISYTVAEEQVSGYTMSVSGDMYKGYTITNSKGGRVPNTSDNFNAFGWASSTILSLLLAVYSALMLGRNTA